MAGAGAERRLAAIVSVDVVGYSRLMQADEAGTFARLKAYRKELVEPAVAAKGGRVVKLMGDGMLIEFASAVDALACAVAVQRGLAERNAPLPSEQRIEARIGINVGDVIVEGDDIFGDGVNIAARLQALAEPGTIYVSGDAQRFIGGRLDLRLEDRGMRALKNIAEPVHVWRWVASEGNVAVAAPSPAPSARPSARFDQASIVVLPFANMSADAEQEYFADGITEDLITDLSKIAGLLVIARNSAFVYKGRAVRVDEVCRELGVKTALEGSVRRAGNRVRVTAQLIDGATGGHLWAERYDRQLDDIFAVQDDVTHSIVTALKLKLSAGEERRMARQHASSLEAYDWFLKGLELANRFTKEANAEARRHYERALALDPAYADALAALANSHVRDWTLGWSDAPEESLQLAHDTAQRALALDTNQADACATLAFALLWMKRHERALVEAAKAAALGPNNGNARMFHSLVLSFSGRVDEAIPEAELCLRLDPKWPSSPLWALGHAYYLKGQHEEARALFARSIAANPNFLPPHIFLAALHADAGRWQEAKAEIAAAAAISPYGATLAWARSRLPYRDPAVLDRLIGALRRAGLPADGKAERPA